MSRADTDFLQFLTNDLLNKNINDNQIADVITFTQATWGLNFSLLPAQKFILKCLYRLPLDNTNKYIPVKDVFCEETLDVLTEEQFLQFLIKQGRTNIVSLEKYKESVGEKRYNEMVVCAGRRGSKCRSFQTQMFTTAGIIKTKEFLDRFNSGQKIGINTFNPQTGKIEVTYDIKAQYNGYFDCVHVETNHGKFDETTLNHPYLVWNSDMIEPQWVEAKDLKIGDLIACSSYIDTFGTESIGVNRAKLLGYLYGDGGLLTNSVIFTNKNKKVIDDFKTCLKKEFPTCQLSHLCKYDYNVVKKDRKKNVINPFKQWLKQIKCFGLLAKEKRIPDIIKRSTKEQVSSFINALFACDGYVRICKPHKGHKKYSFKISITLSSKQFVYDIQKILLCYNIHSTIKPKTIKQKEKIFKAWVLTINDSRSNVIFCKQIGITGKEEKIKQTLDNNITKEYKPIAPAGIWNRIEAYKKNNNISYSKIYGTINRYDNNRLKKFTTITNRKALRCAENMNDDIIKKYCNGEITWEKVSDIVNIGKQHTVAIQVKGTNIIADSIITHNTNLSSVIAAYQIYRVLKKNNPQAYYGFPQAEQIFFTCASVDSDGAVDLLNKIKSRFFGCPILKDKQVGDGAEYLTLQTDHDIQTYGARMGVPTIKVNTGACASNGLRGKNSIMVILDQVAFFGDNQNSKFSGTNVYNALTPSCASFKRKDAPINEKGDGLVVLISSPKKQTGIFWQTYQNSFKMSDDILMFRLYSSLMNPQNDSNYLRLQYKKNPQVFDVQFGANFSTKSTHFITDKQILLDCVDLTQTSNPRQGNVSKDYYLAVDLSYKNDATALALVHKQEDLYYVDYVNAYFPGSSDIWSFPNSIYQNYNQLAEYPTFSVDLIGQVIEDLSKRFMIKKGIYDQWSGGYPLETLLYNRGLERIQMTSFGPNVNSLIVDLFQSLLRDKKLRFWNCQPMIDQFMTLEVQNLRSNFRKVQAPQQEGYHDDIFDAVSRAIYLCYINTQKTSKKITVGAGSAIPFGDNSGYMLSQMKKSKIHGTVNSRIVNGNFGIGGFK